MPASRGTSSKLYYNHGFLRQRMQMIQDEFAKHGKVGPFEKWLKNWDPELDVFASRVTTRVECSEYFAQRDDALRAHATQIDPTGDFFTAPIEWQQRLWPTEEFELARSRVPVDLPETTCSRGSTVNDRRVDDRRPAGRRRTTRHGPRLRQGQPVRARHRGDPADRNVPAGVVDEPAPQEAARVVRPGEHPEPDQAVDEGTVGSADDRRADPAATMPRPGTRSVSRGANELGAATSPYLRQHADNPVHWQQWTPEALAEAATRDVPILLSIGYAACHWCHVMAHESFEDDEVAAAMNAGLRLHQGRPRGAARPRRGLHERHRRD